MRQDGQHLQGIPDAPTDPACGHPGGKSPVDEQSLTSPEGTMVITRATGLTPHARTAATIQAALRTGETVETCG
jgi:hypothetical protein